MSFNPGTGLVYIPTMQMGQRTGAEEAARLVPDDRTGTLLAWDPVAQKKRWEVRYQDSFFNGETMSTAGNLVFQGTGRGQFVAYNANAGAKLWNFNAGLGIIAAPIFMKSVEFNTSRFWDTAVRAAFSATCSTTNRTSEGRTEATVLLDRTLDDARGVECGIGKSTIRMQRRGGWRHA